MSNNRPKVSCALLLAVVASACNNGSSGSRPPALAMLTAPAITMAANAPLASVLAVTTNRASRLILDLDDGQGHAFRIEYPEETSDHAATILGTRPGRQYQVRVTVTTPSGKETTWTQNLVLETPPLPDGFPEIRLLNSDPAEMEPGFTLLDARRKDFTLGFIIVVDETGEVVWHWQALVQSETERLPNGRFLSLDSRGGLIQEIDMLGEVHAAWHAARSTDGTDTSLPVDAGGFHHDVVKLPAGDNYLTSIRDSSRQVEEFPVNEQDPSETETVTVRDEPVIEFDPDGNIVAYWSFLDTLKPTRIAYDGTRGLPAAADWVHLNAICYDPRDDSILASLRHQDAVVKFSRATGELQWILGPHANWEGFESYLLTPTGAEFSWPYHTHAPMLTLQGTVLLFDNGVYKASPFTGQEVTPATENFSRAVEFLVNETDMTVSQVWEYGLPQSGERLYAPFVGDADHLPLTGNVLVTFGGLCVIDGVSSDKTRECRSSGRVIEVKRDGLSTKVFDLAIQDADPDSLGYVVYRSERLATLYADTAVQLTSLSD